MVGSVNFHIRSISLPSRFQSNCIEAELKRLQTFDSSSTSDTIQTGFTRLAELYNSIEELIRSPLTQQALHRQRHAELVEVALDGSVGMLDACTAARDIILTMKEKVEDLQSALLSPPIVDADYHLLMVVKALRESSAITISSFWSLLLFFSMPVMKTKPGGLFSKLIPAAAEKGQKFLSEVGMTDIAVCNLRGKIRKGDAKIDVQMELSRLETIYDKMRGLESGLDCLFRSLIRHRVSLLNILAP
ncbi:hypothetical protein SLEP1_g52259 [Rubroshorea leprosula]|uniref:Uncharacterized protein n=1 Tax=Rubroshorea leprosula TaxID=152421 RepID=A0AAV5M7G6_9ROSI|nr:hypothetical protein SLEP1_g52259 [Rubroshorea leprosula]